MTVPYEIVSASNDTGTLQVRFFNPDYTGLYKTDEGDGDPFPHAEKTVVVPFLLNGDVDHPQLKVILESQARGVANRMRAAKSAMNYGTADLCDVFNVAPPPTPEEVRVIPEPIRSPEVD